MSTSQGGRHPDVSDEELVEIIKEYMVENNQPVVTSKQIGERVNAISYRAVRARMPTLVEREKLRSMKTGSGAVYWPPDLEFGFK